MAKSSSIPIDDFLIGAKAIAAYDPLIGDEKKAQRVYDLFRRHDTRRRYPIIQRGNVLISRKSWIDAFYGAANDNGSQAGGDAA